MTEVSHVHNEAWKHAQPAWPTVSPCTLCYFSFCPPTGEISQCGHRQLSVERLLLWSTACHQLGLPVDLHLREMSCFYYVHTSYTGTDHISQYCYCCSSVAKQRLTLCNPMDCSTPGFPGIFGIPFNHHLPEFAQTYVHRVSDAIQPSHPLWPPSPTFNLSQHQGLFQ